MTIIFPCQLAEINPLSTDCTTIGANILYNLSKKNEKRKRAFAYTYLKIRMTYIQTSTMPEIHIYGPNYDYNRL